MGLTIEDLKTWTISDIRLVMSYGEKAIGERLMSESTTRRFTQELESLNARVERVKIILSCNHTWKKQPNCSSYVCEGCGHITAP